MLLLLRVERYGLSVAGVGGRCGLGRGLGGG